MDKSLTRKPPFALKATSTRLYGPRPRPTRIERGEDGLLATVVEATAAALSACRESWWLLFHKVEKIILY
jgi:hypothetical protein